MALRLAPVATCDKHSNWGEVNTSDQGECHAPPVIELSTGKILCLQCAHREVGFIASGSIPTAEFSAFDAEEAAENMGKVQPTNYGGNNKDITHCDVCGKGPFKHLQAHRRKYHNKFVRGPKKDNPGRADMEELPNLEPEATRQLVDPDKVPPPPGDDF